MIYFTMGLPGSGKTHAVKEMQKHNASLRLVSKDDIRKMLFPGKYYFSRNKEELVKSVERSIVETLVQKGYDVAIHNTHLAGDHLEYYSSLAESYHVEFEILDFRDVSLDVCLVRDHLREDSVGYRVILGMAKKYMPEMYFNFYQHWDDDFLVATLNSLKIPVMLNNLPKCIICDVDGTLALMGNRGPYDTELAIGDTPNIPIINLVKLLKETGHYIFLFSGRKEYERQVTEKWLQIHNVPYDKLVLRKSDDDRPDSIVKKEMYGEHITNQYNCFIVIDDRDSVVGMWRKELGLCTLQCNYGAF